VRQGYSGQVIFCAYARLADITCIDQTSTYVHSIE
jgi:hypothetical protein